MRGEGSCRGLPEGGQKECRNGHIPEHRKADPPGAVAEAAGVDHLSGSLLQVLEEEGLVDHGVGDRHEGEKQSHHRDSAGHRQAGPDDHEAEEDVEPAAGGVGFALEQGRHAAGVVVEDDEVREEEPDRKDDARNDEEEVAPGDDEADQEAHQGEGEEFLPGRSKGGAGVEGLVEGGSDAGSPAPRKAEGAGSEAHDGAEGDHRPLGGRQCRGEGEAEGSRGDRRGGRRQQEEEIDDEQGGKTALEHPPGIPQQFADPPEFAVSCRCRCDGTGRLSGSCILARRRR